MEIERLKSLSNEDRKLVLQAEALAIVEGKFVKPLGPEELAFYKDQLAEKSILQATILDELKDVKADFSDIKKSLSAVKFKQVECEGTLYKMADFDTKMIHQVDELGNVISSRSMMPEERQRNLFQKWQIAVERVITEFNDQKGNSDFRLETKVREVAGMVSLFDLNISIFQGYEKLKFTVEIGLDPKNTAVMLYLISDDLIELEIGQREKLIDSEMEKFNDFPCSKVVIS